MSLQFLYNLNGTNNGHFKKYLDGFASKCNPSISWYVSSGSDFRNPIFLNERYMNKFIKGNNNWEPPNLFLYTDYYTPFFDNLFPFHMTQSFVKRMSKFEALLSEHADIGGWHLYQDDRTSVRVKRFEYLPTIKSRIDKELVDFTDIGNEPKKVVYILLEFWSKQFGRFDVNLVYANVENEFMANMLVQSKAEITHITHVRYGSGFGFAKATGAYLKNILHKLKVKYFISDPYLTLNDGDKAALKLYPSLKSDGYKSILTPLHVIPSVSWSCHGDVTIYKVKNYELNLN